MAAHTDLSDIQLTELLQQGDARAFSIIYDRYWKPIYQACYNRLRHADQSKDLVQNVFISLWDRREVVQIGNLSAYLHTAVKFQILKLAEKSSRIEFLSTFENLINEPVEKNDVVEEREILRLLQLFIDALPEKRRAIFIKRYQENYTTAQIADEMGITQKTVLNQLNNAETALRMRLAHLSALSIIAGFWLKK